MGSWAEFGAAALQAGASLYASNQAAKAAKGAGNAAAAGSEAATALQRDIYNDQRALNLPFLQSQLAALNQYNALMGLPPVSMPSSPTAGAGLTQKLVDRNAQGVPIPNEQLYAADPAYRAAWDQTLQQHRGKWRNGYWHGSDAGWIESNMRSRLPSGWSGGPQTGGPAQQTPTTQPAMTREQAFSLFRNTPGYQFGLDQGNRSIQASAAARGGLLSGATLKAMQRYGNDYADQQGFTPYMNRIAAAAGIGQVNPVSNLQSAGNQYGSNAGQFMQNAANARASGLYGAAGARAAGINQAGGFLADAWRYYQNGGGQ